VRDWVKDSVTLPGLDYQLVNHLDSDSGSDLAVGAQA
jgi:hypothetical protein